MYGTPSKKSRKSKYWTSLLILKGDWQLQNSPSSGRCTIKMTFLTIPILHRPYTLIQLEAKCEAKRLPLDRLITVLSLTSGEASWILSVVHVSSSPTRMMLLSCAYPCTKFRVNSHRIYDGYCAEGNCNCKGRSSVSLNARRSFLWTRTIPA